MKLTQLPSEFDSQAPARSMRGSRPVGPRRWQMTVTPCSCRGSGVRREASRERVAT